MGNVSFQISEQPEDTAGDHHAPKDGKTMTRRARRKHTPAFRAKVALAAIKGNKTLAELAQQFDIHPNQITQWKGQLPDDAAGAGLLYPTPADRGSLQRIALNPDRFGA
ncbi:transposase-like protein [Skermanella aerolata]